MPLDEKGPELSPNSFNYMVMENLGGNCKITQFL